jgi:hypothetical protein
MVIIKVQVELVGASLIATFSEQSTAWPPYRIDNFTTLNVRFRQQLLTTANPNPTPTNTITSTSAVNTQVPWTNLNGLESIGYTWDYPQTGEKIIDVEFFQGNQWVNHSIALDNLAHSEKISFFRNLPDLASNFAEGFLEKYDPLLDTWNVVYCVLLTNVFYMFTDNTKKKLVGIINLSRPHEKQLLLVKVAKHTKPIWDIVENIETTISLLGFNFTGLAAINPKFEVYYFFFKYFYINYISYKYF